LAERIRDFDGHCNHLACEKEDVENALVQLYDEREERILFYEGELKLMEQRHEDLIEQIQLRDDKIEELTEAIGRKNSEIFELKDQLVRRLGADSKKRTFSEFSTQVQVNPLLNYLVHEESEKRGRFFKKKNHGPYDKG